MAGVLRTPARNFWGARNLPPPDCTIASIPKFLEEQLARSPIPYLTAALRPCVAWSYLRENTRRHRSKESMFPTLEGPGPKVNLKSAWGSDMRHIDFLPRG